MLVQYNTLISLSFLSPSMPFSIHLSFLFCLFGLDASAVQTNSMANNCFGEHSKVRQAPDQCALFARLVVVFLRIEYDDIQVAEESNKL